MMDIIGLELSHDDRQLLAHPLIGGVILFTPQLSQPFAVAETDVPNTRDKNAVIDYRSGPGRRAGAAISRALFRSTTDGGIGSAP